MSDKGVAAATASFAEMGLGSQSENRERLSRLKQEHGVDTNAMRPYVDDRQSEQRGSSRYNNSYDRPREWRPDSSRFRSPERGSVRDPRDRDRIRCFECCGFGHFARDCPNNRRASSRQSSDYRRQDDRDSDRFRRRSPFPSGYGRSPSREWRSSRNSSPFEDGPRRESSFRRRRDDSDSSYSRYRDSESSDRTSRWRDRSSSPSGKGGVRFNPSHTAKDCREYYVDCTLNDIPVRCFLDCGCAASSMSRAFYTSRIGSLASLDGDRELAIAFNGSTSPIHGSLIVRVAFGRDTFPLSVKVVEACNYDVMLGADFFDRCVYGFFPGEAMLKLTSGQSIPLIKQVVDVNAPPTILCESDTVVDARSFRAVRCVQVGKLPPDTRATCLADFEPFVESSGLAVANCLLDPRNPITVRLSNFSDAPVTVKKGSQIATLCPCEQLPYSIAREVNVNASRPSVTRPHIRLSDVGTDVSSLSSSQAAQLQKLLDDYAHLFAGDDSVPGRTDLVEHHIDLKEGSRPFKLASRRFPMQLQSEADKEIRRMLRSGIVEPSNSEYSSAPVLVRKKDGSIRFCVDYRKLNEQTIKDSYPLPRINEAIDSIGRDAKFFSKLDLAMGYHQVPVAREDRHKTAFSSRHGLLQYTSMPFGLTNAPATFQRLMEKVLSHLNWKDCLVYIDDVLIWSKTVPEHLDKLEAVFHAFDKAGLRLKTRKCQICCQSVPYLGHLLSSAGIQMDPARIKAVRDMRAPSSRKEVQCFLGLVNYYRRFVPNLSKVEAPLRALVSATRFEWNSATASAFDRIKELICKNTVLAYPDPSAKLLVDTDASDEGLGAVISQVGADGIERPISFASRALSPSEKKWTVMERECLAIVWAVTEQFHCYVYGASFTVRTDNRPLKWLMKLQKPSPRLARWILKLQEYEIDIQHRAGSANRVADALSRLPVNALFFGNDKSREELKAKQSADPDLAPLIALLSARERG